MHGMHVTDQNATSRTFPAESDSFTVFPFCVGSEKSGAAFPCAWGGRMGAPVPPLLPSEAGFGGTFACRESGVHPIINVTASAAAPTAVQRVFAPNCIIFATSPGIALQEGPLG
jgi:hypothetical protein